MQARDAICSGELDFVYSTDRAGNPAWSNTTVSTNLPSYRPWNPKFDTWNKDSAVSKEINSVIGVQHQDYSSLACDSRHCLNSRNKENASYNNAHRRCPIACALSILHPLLRCEHCATDAATQYG